MANAEAVGPADSEKQDQQQLPRMDEEARDTSSSDSDWDKDSDSDSSTDDEEEGEGPEDYDPQKDVISSYIRRRGPPEETDDSPETNVRRFMEAYYSKPVKRMREEEEEDYVDEDELWNFPPDPENWREEDLQELWADAPLASTKPGWDPVWADEEDWEIVMDELEAGRDPPYAPFYIPYRQPYPVIPEDNYDVSNPKAAIEELDRIEEFLNWVSYVFADGSSYEGTVWDDLAHGKGVYVAEAGRVRYEGEWLQNNMDGHGVVQVDIPDIEPVPGSKLEAKMRAEGRIISRDFMAPEDREWLEKDIEDSIKLAGGFSEIPFYENEEWVRQFGRKPEKGRYRYAGQWKHGRMHGCGVYEVNERPIHGRFYFGELLQEEAGCDVDISAMHAGIAEVAAAKARMFVNKPDGMVREERGPYNDPQHPYFYEEEDVWMAPGFINQFYEVADYWKAYVQEVDQEREMWLNSFYKSPLRLPMPAELEYWWSKDEDPEFVLINKEPEPDPEDPSKLIYTEDPLILHTPTGRVINYVEDEEHGIRLFWQPHLEDGEDLDLDKVEFLPLGYDEFFGRVQTVKKENIWKRTVMAVENALKPTLDKLEKWTEEKKKASEMKLELMEKELELVEAELCLEETIEDIDEELKMEEEEEEKRFDSLQEEEDAAVFSKQDEKASVQSEEEEAEEEEEEGEEEEEEDNASSSFGSVFADQGPVEKDGKNSKSGESPFSSLSISFASRSLVSMVPSRVQQSFLLWKEGGTKMKLASQSIKGLNGMPRAGQSVKFLPKLGQERCLKSLRQDRRKFQVACLARRQTSQLHSLSKILSFSSASVDAKKGLKQQKDWSYNWKHASPERKLDSILSLHIPVHCLDSYTGTIIL